MESAAPDYPSLAAMHRSVCRRWGERSALRYRRDGTWHEISWGDYRRLADRAAAGLIALGVKPGERVGLLSENRWEWLVADQAVLSAGAADVPLHAPLSPAQVRYQLGHSGCRGVFVSGPEQAEKVRAVLGELPDLEFVVAFDPVEPLGRLRTLSWQGLLHGAASASAGIQNPESRNQKEIHDREAALTPDSLATIIYTSGTTGDPKGVMLTHGNLVSNAAGVAALMEPRWDDLLLSWLPYSHIYARLVDEYLAIYGAITVCLADSIDTILRDLHETHPTWITAVPRFYEKVWAGVEWFQGDNRRRALQNLFGPRIARLTSGGAPLPVHICEGFHEAGLPLLEGYGLTETSPVISFNHEHCYRIGSVGQPLPNVEVKIAEDGEILTRGPHVMKGYWKDPEATAETIVDGWLHTGDVGRIDEDGFLFITGRKKDLIITAGGKNVAPAELERLLTRDPYVEQAVLYGDGKPFVTALLVPSMELLQRKAAELGCELNAEGEFIASPEIESFLGERVEAAMQPVSRPERVKKFLILHRPLSLEHEEITPSLKVRRAHIIEKYRERFDALYQQNLENADYSSAGER